MSEPPFVPACGSAAPPEKTSRRKVLEIVAAGVAPLDGVKKLEGHFFTMHMVDMSRIGRGGEIVPFGEGASQLGKVLDELKRQNFDGTITCEYERMSPTLEKEIGECVAWYNTYLGK